NATVNLTAANATDHKFALFPYATLFRSIACSALPGEGTSPVAVSATLSGLTANTTYHFRISATNASGSSKGLDASLKTLPAIPPPSGPTTTCITPTHAATTPTASCSTT